MVNTETILFKLISLGLEEKEYCNIPLLVDWKCLWKMASEQGVSAFCLDGLQLLEMSNSSLETIYKQLKIVVAKLSVRHKQIKIRNIWMN